MKIKYVGELSKIQIPGIGIFLKNVFKGVSEKEAELLLKNKDFKQFKKKIEPIKEKQIDEKKNKGGKK